MSNVLEDIWQRQADQQRNWYYVESLPGEERVTVLNDLMLSLFKQVSDLDNSLARERYHVLRRPPPPTAEDIAEAGVDIFKMLMSVLQLQGVSCAQFTDAFYTKSEVVDNKWRCEQADLSKDVTVVMVDLDGCVADWAEGFIAYCASNGHKILPAQVNDPMLEALKDAFHSSGGFKNLRPIPWSIEGLKTIRQKHKVVVVTARPYHQFKRIYSDTMHWLKFHGVEYDHLMFENNKANAVLRILPASVVGFIEDRAKHALEVALTGVPVYKLPSLGPEKVEHINITHVRNWAEIIHRMKEREEADAAA